MKDPNRKITCGVAVRVTSLEQHVRQSQNKEKHDVSIKQHSFPGGESVYALNHRGTPKRILGVAISALPSSKLENGTETRFT